MFFFDPLYFLFALPPMLLGLWAQSRVKSAFKKYSQVTLSNRISGEQVARLILERNGLDDVGVERSRGRLSDHYDPLKRKLRLSEQVYELPSIASVGVAAHEAGHALQHAQGYFPLQVRSAMVPVVQFGSSLGPIMFMIGLFIAGSFGTMLSWVGIGLFGAVALFALVTLPVEFDASRRAKQVLVAEGIVNERELQGVDAVLDAAALTYVASAAQAIMQLLYFVMVARRR